MPKYKSNPHRNAACTLQLTFEHSSVGRHSALSAITNHESTEADSLSTRRLLRCLPHSRFHERPESAQQRAQSPSKCRRLLPAYEQVCLRAQDLIADEYVEIGHEKAQSVIDSITSSYAAEGQAGQNPMLQQPRGGMGPGGFGPPPFAFGGGPGMQRYLVRTILFVLTYLHARTISHCWSLFLAEQSPRPDQEMEVGF